MDPDRRAPRARPVDRPEGRAVTRLMGRPSG